MLPSLPPFKDIGALMWTNWPRHEGALDVFQEEDDGYWSSDPYQIYSETFGIPELWRHQTLPRIVISESGSETVQVSVEETDRSDPEDGHLSGPILPTLGRTDDYRLQSPGDYELAPRRTLIGPQIPSNTPSVSSDVGVVEEAMIQVSNWFDFWNLKGQGINVEYVEDRRDVQAGGDLAASIEDLDEQIERTQESFEEWDEHMAGEWYDPIVELGKDMGEAWLRDVVPDIVEYGWDLWQNRDTGATPGFDPTQPGGQTAPGYPEYPSEPPPDAGDSDMPEGDTGGNGGGGHRHYAMPSTPHPGAYWRDGRLHYSKNYLWDPHTGRWVRRRRRRRQLLTDSDYNALIKLQTLKNTDIIKIAVSKAIGR